MTQEEKAKAYDEALKRAKAAIDIAADKELVKGVATTIFPELRESEPEDERIRKWLVGYFGSIKDTVWIHRNTITCEQILEWLEKQKVNTEGDFGRGYDCGYQAGYAIAKNEMKPKVATATRDSKKQKELMPPVNVDPCDASWDAYYQRGLNKGYELGLEAGKKEQKPSIFPPGLGEVHWNPIPSGKDAYKWNLPEDFEEAVYKVANFISPFDSQEELRKVSHRFAEQLLDIAKRDLQKPAWSEEDEEIIYSLRSFLIQAEQSGRYGSIQIAQIEQCLNWLKSLRPCPSWKPSEEQMDALNKARRFIPYNCDILESLYEQLKKL